jgi:hypothetical protein
MLKLLKNNVLLLRIAAVCSIIWLGGIFIASVLVRNFPWFVDSYNYDAYIRGFPFGPAMVVGAAGVVVIYAVSVTIPWVIDALGDRPSGR